MLVNSCYVSKQFKKPRDNSYSKKSSTNSDIQSESEDNFDTGPLYRVDSRYINMNKTPDIYLRDWGCSSVLIVDDSPFNILILHEIFEKLIPIEISRYAIDGSPKFTIDEATNGLQAVNKVKESLKKSCWRGYEVIFMDLNMPVMDGATATNYIVKMQEDNLVSKELRVIALTAYDSPEHKELWMNSGMKGFLNKPVCIDSIIKVLNSI
jgi:CheY-like chemotaxis protein